MIPIQCPSDELACDEPILLKVPSTSGSSSFLIYLFVLLIPSNLTAAVSFISFYWDFVS